MSGAEQFLRGLAAADETCLSSVLTTPGSALGRDVRALVRLAALLAVDGPTASVCWAAELASVTGAGDEELVAVLVAVMSCARAAQLQITASRLAAALSDR